MPRAQAREALAPTRGGRLKSACWRTSAPRGSQNGIYGISRRDAASFRLDVRRTDHLGPLLGLVDDELAERAGHRLAAEPSSASRTLILGSASGALISLLSFSRSRPACPWARRCRTTRSPHSPARTRRWWGGQAAPPSASRLSPLGHEVCRPSRIRSRRCCRGPAPVRRTDTAQSN